MGFSRAKLHRLREIGPGEFAQAVVGKGVLWAKYLQTRYLTSESQRVELLNRESDTGLPCSWFAIPSPQVILSYLDRSKLCDSIAFLAGQGMRHRFHLFGLVAGQAPAADRKRRRIERMRRLLQDIDGGAKPEGPVKQRLANGDYEPVDWWCDVRSGYVWPERRRGRSMPLDPSPGVDIKVPWELNRFQHLAMMGLHSVRLRAEGDRQGAEAVVAEVVLQIIDWIAANPPRYGINWRYPMEIGLRAWNWIWALALLQDAEALSGRPTEVIVRSLLDHALLLETYVRYSPEKRNNHYLSYVVGALGIACCLPETRWSNRLIAVCIRELRREMTHRIYPDGSCHERTTAYHRLVTEMFVWATSLVLHLPADRMKRVRCALRDPVRHEGLESQPAGAPFSCDYWDRLARMVYLLGALEQPDGLSPLIGDCDSGRLHKLIPCGVVDSSTGRFIEESRDFRGTLAAGRALLGWESWLPDDSPFTLEAILAAGGADLNRRPRLEEAHVAAAVAAEARTVLSRVESGIESVFDNACSASVVFKVEHSSGWVAENPSVTVFPHFGLAVLRNGAFWLGVRLLREGTSSNGHMHCDESSFVLNVAGRTLIVDPGSAVYIADIQERNRFRGGHYHSRCMLAEQATEPWPSGVSGCFFLRVKGSSRLVHIEPDEISLVYSFDGRPARRTFHVVNGELRLTDEWVLGERKDAIVCVLPLAPEVQVSKVAGNILLLGREDNRLLLRTAFGWVAEIEPMIVSPGFGVRQDSTCVKLRLCLDGAKSAS